MYILENYDVFKEFWDVAYDETKDSETGVRITGSNEENFFKLSFFGIKLCDNFKSCTFSPLSM